MELALLVLCVSAVGPLAAPEEILAAVAPDCPRTFPPLQVYANTRTLVDESPVRLIRVLPELEGLEPAQDQSKLSLILKKTGENVEAFFQSFPNTISLERTRQERLGRNGKVQESLEQKFQYMVLAHPEQAGLGLKEFRTDLKGRETWKLLKGAGMLTVGFASQPIYLHPLYQAASSFRYLGRQSIAGDERYVIVFAQHIESPPLLSGFEAEGTKLSFLLQGIVWIDSTSYQIVRMRTDIMQPLSLTPLEKETTEIDFGEEQIKGAHLGLWLPRNVLVSIQWNGRIFRNRHQYSDFRLFKSTSRIITPR